MESYVGGHCRLITLVLPFARVVWRVLMTVVEAKNRFIAAYYECQIVAIISLYKDDIQEPFSASFFRGGGDHLIYTTDITYLDRGLVFVNSDLHSHHEG